MFYSCSSSELMNINFYVVVPAVVLSHLIAFGIGLVINVIHTKAVAMFFIMGGGGKEYWSY